VNKFCKNFSRVESFGKKRDSSWVIIVSQRESSHPVTGINWRKNTSLTEVTGHTEQIFIRNKESRYLEYH